MSLQQGSEAFPLSHKQLSDHFKFISKGGKNARFNLKCKSMFIFECLRHQRMSSFPLNSTRGDGLDGKQHRAVTKRWMCPIISDALPSVELNWRVTEESSSAPGLVDLWPKLKSKSWSAQCEHPALFLVLGSLELNIIVELTINNSQAFIKQLNGGFSLRSGLALPLSDSSSRPCGLVSVHTCFASTLGYVCWEWKDAVKRKN